MDDLVIVDHKTLTLQGAGRGVKSYSDVDPKKHQSTKTTRSGKENTHLLINPHQLFQNAILTVMVGQ